MDRKAGGLPCPVLHRRNTPGSRCDHSTCWAGRAGSLMWWRCCHGPASTALRQRGAAVDGMRAVRLSQCGDIASLMQTFRRALDHAVARFPDVCNVVFSDAFYLGARRMWLPVSPRSTRTWLREKPNSRATLTASALSDGRAPEGVQCKLGGAWRLALVGAGASWASYAAGPSAPQRKNGSRHLLGTLGRDRLPVPVGHAVGAVAWS